MVSMRVLFGLFFMSSMMLLAGCSALESTAYLTPIPDATLQSYKFGAPIESRLEAVIVGRKMLCVLHSCNIGTPKVISADEMSFEDANKRIGRTDAHYDYWPRDIGVWLVIFEGEWQLIPPDPTHTATLPAPAHGCEFSLFAAKNGESIAGGDVKCPTKP